MKPPIEDVAGRWHSQAGQDRLVLKLLQGKTSGFFVDLAANDALHLSNTRALERDFGWRGLCIEGNPLLTTRLAQVRDCSGNEIWIRWNTTGAVHT